MSFIRMQCKIVGKTTMERVYLEKGTEAPFNARVYRGSKVVSGTVEQNSRGVPIFTPMGKNASLV